MATTNLRDVFRHGLGAIYDAEQQILTLLDEVETETECGEIRSRIRRHREETQHRIQNLERCFELLGAEAPRVRCAAVRGMREEKRQFRDEHDPSPTALEIYNLDTTQKTEHFAIASYRGLLRQAGAVGNDDVRRLLDQNLRQAEAMAAWAEDRQARFLDELHVRR